MGKKRIGLSHAQERRGEHNCNFEKQQGKAVIVVAVCAVLLCVCFFFLIRYRSRRRAK